MKSRRRNTAREGRKESRLGGARAPAAQTLLVASLLLAPACISGCAYANPEHLPTYRWTDPATALRIIRTRADAVRTLSAQCLLTLTRPGGESVRLDGALVMDPRQRLVRLRAWKFNQAVLDLTLNGQGLWIESRHDAGDSRHALPPSLSAGQVAEALSLLGPGLFDDATVDDRGGAKFSIVKPIGQGRTVVAMVDRASLTIRQYRLLDSSGKPRFRLSLEQYQPVQGVIWPTRMIATSAGGNVEIDLRDVEINASLPVRAFVPPARAEKVR